jgi:hypothetical protein
LKTINNYNIAQLTGFSNLLLNLIRKIKYAVIARIIKIVIKTENTAKIPILVGFMRIEERY